MLAQYLFHLVTSIFNRQTPQSVNEKSNRFVATTAILL